MDTIASVSTPPGRGGIGIVRMSGPESLAIAGCVFSHPERLEPRKMAYGHILDAGRVCDEVLACYFQAPHSYTCEDMVEIHCHGGYTSTLYILDLLVRFGARIAEAGEFTKRAFFNGRIDLLEAEAVEGIIDSQSREAQRLYAGVLTGSLSRAIGDLRERLLALLAECEAKIDYPELGETEDFAERIEALCLDMEHLLADEARTGWIREGVATAIVGRPNVGKSSLLNALVQRERAIVTDVPGTTRDTVEETIDIGGTLLRLIDTAGIRNAEEEVERIGIARSLDAAARADVLVIVLDGSAPLAPDDLQVLALRPEALRFILVNKRDLPAAVRLEEIRAHAGERAVVLEGSIRDGDVVRALVEAMRDAILPDAETDAVSIFKLRHREALRRALSELAEARAVVDALPFEITEVNLRAALDAVDEILGLDTSEDMIERVFQDFCVGK